MIGEGILILISVVLGYILRGSKKENEVIVQGVTKEARAIIKGMPQPGVVRQLSDEEIREKHDPQKQGNLAAFNAFFKAFPLPKRSK